MHNQMFCPRQSNGAHVHAHKHTMAAGAAQLPVSGCCRPTRTDARRQNPSRQLFTAEPSEPCKLQQCSESCQFTIIGRAMPVCSTHPLPSMVQLQRPSALHRPHKLYMATHSLQQIFPSIEWASDRMTVREEAHAN
eukprot:scpid5718/ scgid23010/ 